MPGKRFGFSTLGLKIKDLTDSSNVVQLDYPPNRIDILTSVDALAFEECIEKGIEKEIDGLPMNFIDLKSLIKNKLATNRAQHLADIEALNKVNTEPTGEE